MRWPAFASGTRILTIRGDIAVQSLRAGDEVVLADGGHAPVTWLGHRRLDCQRHPRPRDVMPVRVCAHAFGPGRPGADLFLSPDHAVFIDNVHPDFPTRMWDSYGCAPLVVTGPELEAARRLLHAVASSRGQFDDCITESSLKRVQGSTRI
jgi:hypothetical protein